MPVRNPVADAIRLLRQNYKLTQVELARKAGIPRATLALMENPRGNPSMASVMQVASALGVPVGDLLVRSQDSWVNVVRVSEMTESRQGDGLFISRLLSPASHVGIQMYQVTLLPGCQSRGRPHPKGSLEYFHCTSGGDVALSVNERPVSVHPGELAVFPGHLPHHYSNPGNATVEAFVVVVPDAG